MMDEVNYDGRTYICRIQPEGLLCDGERDLLAIAKFPVPYDYTVCCFWLNWHYAGLAKKVSVNG